MQYTEPVVKTRVRVSVRVRGELVNGKSKGKVSWLELFREPKTTCSDACSAVLRSVPNPPANGLRMSYLATQCARLHLPKEPHSRLLPLHRLQHCCRHRPRHHYPRRWGVERLSEAVGQCSSEIPTPLLIEKWLCLSRFWFLSRFCLNGEGRKEEEGKNLDP